jgi:prevent-host-death family protein
VARNLKKARRGATIPALERTYQPKHSWQLQDAKARFSEVFTLALTEGPQLITRRGKQGVVMIPAEQFDQLVTRSHQPRSLVQFFRESPLTGVKLDLERDKDEGREVDI